MAETARDTRQRIDDFLKRYLGVIIGLWFCGAFVPLWWALENYGWPDSSAHEAHTIMQFFTSNWPALDGTFDRRSWPFAIAVLFKLLLAWTPVTAIFWLFAKLVREGRIMRYRDVLKYRDHAIEINLLNLVDSLPKDRQDAARAAVHQALEKAAEAWDREYAPALLGERGMAEWRHLQDQRISV